MAIKKQLIRPPNPYRQARPRRPEPPRKTPVQKLAEAFRPAVRPTDREERGERSRQREATRPAPRIQLTPGGRIPFGAARPVEPEVTPLSQRKQFEKQLKQSLLQLAQQVASISGRAGVQNVTPLEPLGISGIAGTGVQGGAVLPSIQGVSGTAGVGTFARPEPIQGYAYGVAGTGLVQAPLALTLPQAAAGISGRAGVGLQTGPSIPGIGGLPTAQQLGQISGRAGVSPGGRQLSYTTAGAQTQPTAVGGRAPMAGAVARQEAMALARAARSYAGNVQYAINTGDIRARPAVLSGEIAQSTIFRQMWEGLYASYEEFLADIGYRNLPGTDKWIREDPIDPSGGGLYGGGDGGGRRVRYGGYGGAGGGRGETFGGDSLIQWRIRYTA